MIRDKEYLEKIEALTNLNAHFMGFNSAEDMERFLNEEGITT